MGRLIAVEVRGAVVLVTGASSGIGRATAIELSRRGAHLKLTGRDEAALAETAEAAGASKGAGAIQTLAADLLKDDDLERLVLWAGDDVDVLINNAGEGWAGPFIGVDDQRTEELIRVNLVAPMRLTSVVLQGMIARKRGHIVNVGSIAGHVGVPFETVYSTAKWGLTGFTESLRDELTGTGVGITLVSPGVVRTAFFERSGHPYDRLFPGPISPERVAKAIVRAAETGAQDVFVPRWMAFPARLRGAWPWLYRRLSSRYS